MEAFWLGLAVFVALLEIWSLLRPVNSTIGILLLCVGAAGLIENQGVLFHGFKTALRASGWPIALCLAMVTLVAFRASGPCDYFDTGLYGAPAVRWILTYPAVPGLANVHGRLGFNSSAFLCIAALSQGVWKGLGFHLFTGFVIAAIWFTLLPACIRLVRGSSTSPADWFYCILAIPMAFWAARGKIVGTQTDEPATIACLVAAGMMFEWLHLKDAEGDRELSYARLMTATSLFALAVTFKETTAIFAGLAWCLAFRWICSQKQSGGKRKRHIVGSLAVSASLILPWCARGIISSGYPFFPVTAFGFPVDWKTPFSMAHWYFAGARSWGRMPEVELADTRGLAWLRPWIDHAIRDRASFQVPLLISLGGLAVVLGLRLRRKNWPAYSWVGLLIPSLAGTVFWFVASPAPRFGQFAIWTAAGTLGTWGIVALTCGPRRVERTKIILAGLLGLLVWCLISFGWKQPYERLLAEKALAPLPEVSVTSRRTLSGVSVYVPTKGNQCWDGPLPCTPYFDETLRLRDPRSMRFGFSSEAQESILPRFQVGHRQAPLVPLRHDALYGFSLP